MTEASRVRCRLCGATLTRTFVDLGCMPPANSYLRQGEEESERSYPLHVRVCEKCLLVQVEGVLSAEEIFTDYAYLSSFSATWLEHTRRFATEAIDRFDLGTNSFVLELASNDGHLLKHFIEMGIPVLGVEPARNVAEIALEAGVPTEPWFFGLATAEKILAGRAAADLVVANNVYGHVPDLNDFTAGLKTVLAPGGVISIEVPHILNLIEKVQFDTIYHEHFSYFSVGAIEAALSRHGLRVFDVEVIPTHGGSLRILAGHEEDPRPDGAGVEDVRVLERRAGLDRIDAYEGFEEKVRHCRESLRAFLSEASGGGKSVVGYGAAAKGNTLLCYCSVTKDDIAYVVDRSPLKQGMRLPGSHLPVFPPERVGETRPDYLLILPWNLASEIVDQMSHIREWGGCFVVPVPETRVLA